MFHFLIWFVACLCELTFCRSFDFCDCYVCISEEGVPCALAPEWILSEPIHVCSMADLDHQLTSILIFQLRILQFSSVAQSCPTLCDPMDCSMPGFPVLHCLPESAQAHVHCVSDAIQPSPPLLSPSPLTFNLSQHQGLFQWVSSSHQVAKVLESSASASVLPMNIQDLLCVNYTSISLT